METLDVTTFAHGNITAGQLATRYGSDIIGKVGFFYKVGTEGGALHPMYYRRLVKVTGFYMDRGVNVFTFSDVASVTGGFIRLEGVKFAAYNDQLNAEAVFGTRRRLHTEIYKTYNKASFSHDEEGKAYAAAALEGLMTVD